MRTHLRVVGELAIDWMRSPPQLEGGGDGFDVDAHPPRRFIAVGMEFPVVRPAYGDRELIAHLAAERAGLCEADVMRVGRRAAANDAGLLRDESAVIFVAQSNGLWSDAATARRRGGRGRLG